MKFEPLPVAGAYRISLDLKRDSRGYFARTWRADVFAEHGIDFQVVQANFSQTEKTGSIRAMHHQLAPHPDGKIVRCTRGRIFEVIADVRAGSSTFGAWCPTELTEDNFTMVYVPPGCSQGFQSLTDRVTVEYFMGERYQPDLYSGFRFDDPLIGIEWPFPITAISPQDLAWPPLIAPSGPGTVKNVAA